MWIRGKPTYSQTAHFSGWGRYFGGRHYFGGPEATISGVEAIIFYENNSISATNVNFCEFCEKDARFQKGGVMFANSAKKTHVSQG